MAWTQDDVDALKAAIATGALSVQYSDGSRVDYRSLTDMQRVLKMMQADVAPPSKPTKALRLMPGSGY